jgi:CRP-like cAMP-binding protein
MDEKSERLRDIFVDVTDGDTVTESQDPETGSLLDRGEGAEERLRAVIEAMAERYGFEADLDTPERVALVRAYYGGEDDDAIAASLDTAVETVVRARTEMHLLREREVAFPFDRDDFRERVDGDATAEDLASEFDVSPAAARRYRRAVEVERRSTTANERYRDAFEEVLTDADLIDRLARPAREDGLREATEDIETDVRF